MNRNYGKCVTNFIVMGILGLMLGGKASYGAIYGYASDNSPPTFFTDHKKVMDSGFFSKQIGMNDTWLENGKPLVLANKSLFSNSGAGDLGRFVRLIEKEVGRESGWDDNWNTLNGFSINIERHIVFMGICTRKDCAPCIRRVLINAGE